MPRSIQPKDGKKEYLTIEELKALMATDSYQPEVKQAFIFCLFHWIATQ